MGSVRIFVQTISQSDGFEVYGKKLRNNGCRLTWEAHSYDALMVAFLGIMLFPKKEGKISMNLAVVITAFEKNPNITLVPMILEDIYHALTMC